MTERQYLQLNLDTDTLPTSSVMHDSLGNTLAKLDMNLSSNLVGNLARGRLPQKVDFKITKMSIPVTNIPFSYIPFEELRTNGMESKALMIVVPYAVSRYGSFVRTNAIYTGTDNRSFEAEDSIRAHKLIFDYKAQGDDLTRLAAATREHQAFAVNSLYDIIEALNSCLLECFKESIPYGRPQVQFRLKDDKLQIVSYSRMENNGFGPLPNCSFYRSCENLTLPIPGQEYQIRSFHVRPHLQSKDDYTDSTFTWQNYDLCRAPFSICGNQHLRDLLPSLPWIRVDTNRVSNFNARYHWDDSNGGDATLYVLDTYKTTYTIEEYPAPIYIMDTGTAIPQTPQVGTLLKHSQLVLTFEDVSPLSMSSISSFVLMTNGLDASQQIFPVNITANSDASSQIPIIEVYYPLWERIEDKSDRIIVTKDDFTNSPTFSTNNYCSICDRNITFQLYASTAGGKLIPVSLVPRARFALQITFALYY